LRENQVRPTGKAFLPGAGGDSRLMSLALAFALTAACVAAAGVSIAYALARR
jgi:hypothetical protein